MKYSKFLVSTLVAAAAMTVPAFATYTWTGGNEITTDLWGSENSWSLSDDETWSTGGSGPGTTNSDMWNPISVSNASGTISGLEGWALRLTLTNTQLTVGTLQKFQSASDGVSFVTLDSSSSLTVNSFGGGNDGCNVTLNNSGAFAMTYGKDQGGSGFILNLGESSTTTFNLNGHTGKAQSISGAGTVNINGSGTFSLSGTADFGGEINVGSGATLDFNNSGTLALAGAISNSGTLAVSAGSATFSGAVSESGNLVVGSGATATFGSTASFSSVNSSGTLAVNEGGSLSLTGTVSLSEAIQNSGTVTVSSSTVFDLIGFTQSESGVYTVISGNGSITDWNTLSKDSLRINGADLAGRQTADFSTAGKVTISGVVANLVWTGTESSVWDKDTAGNWSSDDVSDTKFYNGDNVSFGSSASNKTVAVSGSLAAGTVSVADGYTFTTAADADGSLSATSITVASGATLGVSAETDRTLTISGAITGEDASSIGVKKTGAGTVSLSNASNKFSSVSVEAGRLEIGGQSVYNGMISSFTVASGAELAIVAGNDLATWGGTTYDIAGTLDTGSARLSISGGSFSVKEGAVISGAGDGSGALDFFGSTTVSVSGDASISAATKIRSSVVTTFDVAESKTLTFSGAIQNAGELKKSGAGTMTLSANSSSYTGTVRVSEGTLKLADDTSVLGAQDYNGTGTRYAAIVESGGTLDVNGQLKGGENCYKIQLSGGSLINTGADVDTDDRQITGLSLTADSSVGGTGNFGVVASMYGATTVDLGGHTLTKTGDGIFWLANTTLTNGTVDIQAGTVSVRSSLTMTGSKFRIDGGALQSITAGVSLGDVEIVLSDTTTASITRDRINQSADFGSFTVGDAAKLYLDISSLALSEAEEVSIRIATANAISGDSFFSDILVGSSDETGTWITSADWAYKADSWNASTGTLLLVSIPEPSAFGLLAGVGALALVAARRRRSRAK